MKLTYVYLGLNNMNNFKNSLKILLTVLRVRYAIFSGNLAPIGEFSSSQRFFKFDWGKITNNASKG
jgi:hypothetical protein